MNIQARLEFQRLRHKAGLSFEEAASITFVSERQVRRYEDITEAGCDPSPLVLEASRGQATGTNPCSGSTATEKQSRISPSLTSSPGIGGLRRGFEPQGGNIVFTSEWDRDSQKTYRANFEFDHPFAGDITKVPLAQIPKHDVLLAGFPCQPVSIAAFQRKMP